MRTEIVALAVPRAVAAMDSLCSAQRSLPATGSYHAHEIRQSQGDPHLAKLYARRARRGIPRPAGAAAGAAAARALEAGDGAARSQRALDHRRLRRYAS